MGGWGQGWDGERRGGLGKGKSARQTRTMTPKFFSVGNVFKFEDFNTIF